ncbi:MAG: sensor histidine kinase [Desulfobaccales bacterium]
MAPEKKNSEGKQKLAKLLAELGQLNANPLLKVNFSGKVTYWSKSAFKILKELGIQEPNSFVPKDLEDIVNTIRQGKETWFYREIRLGNRVFGEDIHGNKSGKVVHIYVIDITALKKVEEARDNLAAIVESSDDAIISKTLDGKITSWNRGASKIYGYIAQEVLGQSISILVPPDRQDEVPKLLQKISRGERVDHFATIHRRKDGQQINVSLTISPLKDAEGEGKITGSSTIARDITEGNRAAEELRQRTAQLAAANLELDAFSYSVAHDLKAPVQAIEGFSRMLMHKYSATLESEPLRLLNIINSNTKRMSQMIDDLLTFSRTSLKKVRKAEINLYAMTTKAFEQLRHQTPERDIQLNIGELPPAIGDPSLIEQVMVNLLANAIKFTRSRKTAVIEVGGRTEGKETIYYVKDNGAGFNEQYAHNLYGVFQRLHSYDDYEGTGIGLAIVKRLIERHGGRVWAEGKVDQGATFHFTLPKNGD